MNVVLNGAAIALPQSASVADAITSTGRSAGFGIAVALNGEVVPRSSWEEQMLNEGDRIEVLVAAQGG